MDEGRQPSHERVRAEFVAVQARLRYPGAQEAVAALYRRDPTLALATARAWVLFDERRAAEDADVENFSHLLDQFGRGEIRIEELDAAGARSVQIRDRAEEALDDLRRLTETMRLVLGTNDSTLDGASDRD